MRKKKHARLYMRPRPILYKNNYEQRSREVSDECYYIKENNNFMVMDTNGLESRNGYNRLRLQAILLICAGFAVYFLVRLGQSHENHNTATVILRGSNRSEIDISNPDAILGSCNYNPRGENERSTGGPVNTFNSTQPCTFKLFREVHLKDHYFPSGGQWVNSTPGKILHYQPNACKFKYPQIPKSFMENCLIKANLSSVLTVGDSTASRYFKSLFKATGDNCKIVRTEKFGRNKLLPDKEYFVSQLPAEVRDFVQIQFRFCGSCASNQVVCDGSGKSEGLRFEHIAQTMVLDDTIQITFPNSHNASGVLDKIWSITSQELIFRYFLKNRYPQVFLIFLPFAHAKHNMQLKRLSMEIQYFKSLVEHYFPDTTKFIYMPAYSEFETVRGNTIWKERLFEGMLAKDKIHKMNDILYTVLEPDIVMPNRRIFTFLDLFEASVSRASWSTDGVHMKPVWYDNIMAMFWETFCNSVMMDKF